MFSNSPKPSSVEHYKVTMLSPSALLSLLLLAFTVVSANPIERDAKKFSLAFAATVNGAGRANIAEADRARAAALRKNALSKRNGKRDGVVSVDNAVVTYTASVGVGSPATQCQFD